MSGRRGQEHGKSAGARWQRRPVRPVTARVWQQKEPSVNTMTPAALTLAYWTPARLRAAKPATVSHDGTRAHTGAALGRPAGPAGSVPGSHPSGSAADTGTPQGTSIRLVNDHRPVQQPRSHRGRGRDDGRHLQPHRANLRANCGLGRLRTGPRSCSRNVAPSTPVIPITRARRRCSPSI